MADVSAQASGSSATPPRTSAALAVPDDIAKKFGPLVDLIRGSESMNDEERQYWVNILPIMTPDQLKNLEDILVNERDQLKAIDEKYVKEIERLQSTETAKTTDEERRSKRENRQSAEASHQRTEARAADDILKQIEGS